MSKKNILEDADYQALQAKLNSPNYFLCSGIMRHEIRHSNFIAWLLNPEGTHSQKSLFLYAFLDSINKKIIDPTKKIETPKTYVNFELVRESKYNIDIFIKYENTVLVIENKVQATDSHEQLLRYRTQVNASHKNHKISFIYWTLTGENPKDVREKDLWHLYSYEHFIDVLESSLPQVDSLKVKLYIEDYIDALEIEHLKGSKYAKKARNLVEKYKTELPKVFNHVATEDSSNKSTIEFLISNSGFVRGDGFFSDDKPYLELFKQNCAQHNCVVRKGNSTYFSLAPLGGDEVWKYFGIAFRFYEEKNYFLCFFGVEPETTDNKKNRDLLLENRVAFYGLENKTNNVTPITNPRAKYHIGIVQKRIEFNPLALTPEDISQKIKNIFEYEVIPFTNMLSQALSNIRKSEKSQN